MQDYISENIDQTLCLAQIRINLILANNGYSLKKHVNTKKEVETRSLQWSNPKINNTIQLIWNGKEQCFYLGEFNSLFDVKEIVAVTYRTTKKFFRKKYTKKIVDELITALMKVLIERKNIKDILISKIENISEINSKLTFERKTSDRHMKKGSVASMYIDFVVNGVSLADMIGGIGDSVGKFGWGYNLDFEISEFNDLKSTNKSRLENGLYSVYVCSECGDEGCGAAMFRVIQKESVVIWTNFVWGNGFDETYSDPDDKIDIEPLVFSKEEYHLALNELKKLITENKN